MECNNVKVLFYEWSDVNRQPIGFLNNDDFLGFCRNSNININKRNLNFLNDNNSIYATCKIGKNELIMSGDYKNLRKNVSKHRNNGDADI